MLVIAAANRVRKQTGVLPYKYEDGVLKILLIESSHAGNWTIPKGKKEKQFTKKESAATEAMEEAGVSGTVGIKLGSFTYTKGSTGVEQSLIVYSMRVLHEHKKYLEADRRVRRWFTFEQAKAVLPKRFKDILKEFEKKYYTKKIQKQLRD